MMTFSTLVLWTHGHIQHPTNPRINDLLSAARTIKPKGYLLRTKLFFEI
jgi:hypothetical protein